MWELNSHSREKTLEKMDNYGKSYTASSQYEKTLRSIAENLGQDPGNDYYKTCCRD